MITSPRGQPLPELTIAAHTLGATCTFAQRVHAAAAAGFTGIGLRIENYLDARAAGFADADLLAVLADADMAVTEVEFADGWATPYPSPAEREREQVLLHMAKLFHVPRINAGLPVADLGGIEDRVAGFAALCDRASGFDVVLEFLPFGPVSTLTAATRLIERADRPTAKLLLDVWHLIRSGEISLGDAPLERIVTLQLNDIGPEPHASLRDEGLHHRLPPGHGDGDVADLVADLDAAGVRPQLVSVEIPSDELLRAGVGHAAQIAFRAACRVLEDARPSAPPVHGPSKERR